MQLLRVPLTVCSHIQPAVSGGHFPCAEALGQTDCNSPVTSSVDAAAEF